MKVVCCKDVKKNFKVGNEKVEILKGITLDIKEGEFVAIIGESGSGKSTFLNILGGLMPCECGEITINENRIDKLNENKLALFRRHNVGFIFQAYNLMPQLSAIENVEMFSGVSKNKRRKRALDMLKKVGLEDRVNHKPSELSGGQQQRVSIARALMNNPKVILADEPTGNLDSKTSVEILELLKELNEKYKTTFVVVTHSKVVYKYATRIIKMKDGLLVSNGEEILL